MASSDGGISIPMREPQEALVYFEYFHIFLLLGTLVLEQIDVWSPKKLFSMW